MSLLVQHFENSGTVGHLKTVGHWPVIGKIKLPLALKNEWTNPFKLH